jgi:acetylornithine deacetylase
MQMLKILDRLIAFPNASSDPNRDLIDFVQNHLGAHGIASEVIFADGWRKTNLFATIGPAGIPGVMLSGHTDVVPVEGQVWTSDPFHLKVRNGKFFGRGTDDMKGFVAAASRLACRAAARTLKTPLHLALSHDEEIGCVGMRSLIDRIDASALRPLLCIVGERTSKQPDET